LIGKILMPKELTAENGAKALLIGEFFEPIEIDGSILLDEEGDPGMLKLEIPVTWATIKEIYAMAVKHFAPQSVREGGELCLCPLHFGDCELCEDGKCLSPDL